ncbi:ABC transporter substrate-binding protein [Ruminococcaceae bacterium OttesenSCG-928-L11]|nr:ABC transporter substrate-binding protein [Ruminococcaceae bacterium OttesenSCG-928-L11]
MTLTIGCTACGSGSGGTGGSAKKIGIIQLVDNGAFTDMREGFQAKMTELGYTEDTLVYDYKNAQGDISNLNTICQDMAGSNLDCIVTIATPPTQAMVNLDSGKPVFYISVSDPLAAGVITDMAKPDKNATGTSNAIPVDEIFKLADELTPGVQTYGILYNTGEVNSVKTVNSAKEYMEGRGIAVKEAIVTASSEVQQAAQSLVGSVDAIFIPNDSMIQSALPQVAQVAKEAGIPVYGSSAVMVGSGAFATISIDDVTIGGMTAEMVHQYLTGTAVEAIPSVVVSQFTTVINKSTADAIGIELSADVLASAVIVE